MGIFCKVTECIWGDHSFTLQVADVKLSTYCLMQMSVSNKTLVQDIQSLVTFLVTVHAASLIVIYIPPSEVKEFQNGADNMEVLFSSIIDILSSYMSLGLYSSEYEEWPSGIWHCVLRYVQVQLPLSMPCRQFRYSCTYSSPWH